MSGLCPPSTLDANDYEGPRRELLRSSFLEAEIRINRRRGQFSLWAAPQSLPRFRLSAECNLKKIAYGYLRFRGKSKCAKLPVSNSCSMAIDISYRETA